MPRAHDRTHFYKYFSANAVEAVLGSAKLRWSVPSLFNDPFDHQTTFVFPFEAPDVARELFVATERILFGAQEPKIEAPTALGSMLLLTRQTIKDRGIGDVRRVMEGGAKEAAERLPNYVEQFNGQLLSQMNHSRVLCLTECHRNVVMWSHYAEQHRGAVLRLECLDEIDDNLLAAKPVVYAKSFPTFVSVEEWIAHLLGEKPIDFAEMFFRIPYVKHVDWAYEKEWRIHMPMLHEPAGTGVSDIDKDPRVFSEIYFGCRMEDARKSALMSLVRDRYPSMKIFEAIRAKSEFALDFREIG